MRSTFAETWVGVAIALVGVLVVKGFVDLDGLHLDKALTEGFGDGDAAVLLATFCFAVYVVRLGAVVKPKGGAEGEGREGGLDVDKVIAMKMTLLAIYNVGLVGAVNAYKVQQLL
jgi:drug/metabolite transporter (DMT)-like permease